MPLTSSAVYWAGSSSARSSSSVGAVSPAAPCGAPEANTLSRSTVSPVNPPGWPSFTWNRAPLGCANCSGAFRVIGFPLTAVIQPVSRLRPVSTKNGWPAVKFAPAATGTVVAPTAVAAVSVDMPAAGTPLESMNDVLAPVYPMTGVARIDTSVVGR